MKKLSIGHIRVHTAISADTFAWVRSERNAAPDGTAFLCDELQHARGRQGRSWEWQPGQVAMTILLKPTHTQLEAEEAASHLVMALSTGLCRALHEHEVKIKWPNDLMLRDKKIGGLLMESVWQEGKIGAFIAGFAININNEFAPDHYLANVATSLKHETALSHDLFLVEESIFTALSTWYDAWKAGEYETIYAAWHECQGYLGKQISVHTKDGVLLSGIMEDVLASGDLLLKQNNGHEVIVPFYSVEEVIV